MRASVERTVERVVESLVERTHVVETRAVAAPPTPLRESDAAILRPAEPKRAGVEVSPRMSGQRLLVAAHDTPGPLNDAIQVSIGRIDVRATTTAPPAAARARPTHAPLGLDEYLRRRNAGG
jgi:hypothetical protein